MAQDWTRLGEAIKRGRMAKGLTQTELAREAGISESSVQNLESGAPRKRLPPTLSKIEKALDWAPGSCANILDGGDPVRVEPSGEGVVIARISEEDLHQSVTSAAIAMTDNLTAREIRELSKRVVEDLKGRGFL